MDDTTQYELSEASAGFRYIPYMGVIYVVHEAHKLGFWNGHPDWCNLGQGQPEVGVIDGAPARVASIDLEIADHAYGPVGGTDALREVVAQHYNRLYRQGKSQYTRDHVSIASGGRLALTRVFSALADQTVAYQIPDYTAYEDMLQYQQHRMRLVLLEGRAENGFAIPASELRTRGRARTVCVRSCSPTPATRPARWCRAASSRSTYALARSTTAQSSTTSSTRTSSITPTAHRAPGPSQPPRISATSTLSRTSSSTA